VVMLDKLERGGDEPLTSDNVEQVQRLLQVCPLCVCRMRMPLYAVCVCLCMPYADEQVQRLLQVCPLCVRHCLPYTDEQLCVPYAYASVCRMRQRHTRMPLSVCRIPMSNSTASPPSMSSMRVPLYAVCVCHCMPYADEQVHSVSCE
jgi:hypothetical protein